jgi:ribonuclease E
VIVQITKEGVGTKGPTLTSYLSIPGRYLVMMPGMNRHGVSRKIEDEAARRKMKAVLNELEFPPGMGFILRTAGLDQTKRELQRDLNYLIRLWKRVVDRVKRMPAPAELYRESGVAHDPRYLHDRF